MNLWGPFESHLQMIQSLRLIPQSSDDFVRAVGIYSAAGLSQDGCQLGKVVSPFGGVKARRFQLSKLTAQQNHPQTMSEHDALLLRQLARTYVAIKVATKTQQVTDTPDAADVDV